MKNSPEVLDRLRIENPFVSSSVGDPMKNRYPDVASINETAFKGLVQLIEQKIRTPDLPCAGMVFGETGSGKTHLISRTLTYRQSKKKSFFIRLYATHRGCRPDLPLSSQGGDYQPLLSDDRPVDKPPRWT